MVETQWVVIVCTCGLCGSTLNEVTVISVCIHPSTDLAPLSRDCIPSQMKAGCLKAFCVIPDRHFWTYWMTVWATNFLSEWKVFDAKSQHELFCGGPQSLSVWMWYSGGCFDNFYEFSSGQKGYILYQICVTNPKPAATTWDKIENGDVHHVPQ